MCLNVICSTAVSVTLGVAIHPERKETAVLSTLPCRGAGLPVLPGGQALEALREFRERLHGCLTARGDTLFELADAVLCADRPVRSLVQLSLEPEFRRGHGALYDALAVGRVDDERLFSLLTETLTALVDGPEARAWIARHDVIDRRLLGQALSGVPAGQAARVRDACARWDRVRVAIDATAYPRPRAECSPGREHVHNGACHCKGSSKTSPGWEYQLAAVTGHLRTAWTAVIDVQRTAPATRTAQTIAQARTVARRLHATGAAARRPRCSSSTPATAPPPSPTAWPATPPTSWSGCPPAAPSTPTRSPGPARTAAPPTGDWKSTAWRPRTSRPPPGAGPQGAEEAAAPEPRARRGPHPARHPALRHRPGRGLARRPPPAPRRPRLVRGPRSPARPARYPRPRHRRPPARRPRPAPPAVALARRPRPAVPGRALARLPRQVRHRALDPHPQGHPRPHRREGPHAPSRPTAGPASSSPPTPSSCWPARWPPTCAVPGRSTPTRPAAPAGPRPPGVSRHPPPPRHPGPCPETRPARPRQAQGKPHGTGTTSPSPR